MKKDNSNMHRQKGLGLIELMIAITLSLLLSAALIQSYLASKTTFQMQDSMSLVQENGRFALNYLSKEIRMAGYIGCPPLSGLGSLFTSLAPAAANTYFPEFKTENVLLAGDAAEYPTLAPSAVADTDVLIVQKGSPVSMQIASSTANSVTLEDNAVGIEDKDLLVISDCSRATLFQADAIAGKKITPNKALPSSTLAYQAGAEVMALESTVFYIRDTERTTKNGQPIHSLYIRTRGAGSKGNTSTAVELIEGVEDMSVEFGINSDGDKYSSADEFIEAKEMDAADWRNVVSVRISLLLQGVDDKAITGDTKMAQTISFGGKDIAADGRLRQVFRTTIAVRNRLLGGEF